VDGVPAVAWAHGTSGVFGECAPSHIRNLWYQYSAPFTLALQGYAVIAPDYAGLGVNHTAEREPVAHQYLAHPAAANDLFYAMQAAKGAFPELSKQFVTMGHSQGGGAAWATAHRQSVTPVEGYLGTVAGSPDPNNYENIKATDGFSVFPRIARGLSSIFPSFNYSDWFEPEGVKRLSLLEDLSGCNAVNNQLFPQAKGLLKPAWEENWYLRAYSNISDPSRKPISGPMLVIQGTGDEAVPANPVSKAVNETCAMYPKSQIRYASFEGASHVPVLNAAQQIWLQWIVGRFMGKDVNDGCTQDYHRPLRKFGSYQKELGYYLQLALQFYEVA
jgi:pimeloyl-ACP methyl ester carboxylesterase